MPNGATPTPDVQPQPLPTVITVGQASGADGARFVGLKITTPAGATVVFLDPDAAIGVAANIHQAAVSAKTGIVVARPGDIPMPPPVGS